MLGSCGVYLELCTTTVVETHLFRPLIAPRRNALLVSSLVHVAFPHLSTSFQSICLVSWIIIQHTLVDDYEEYSATCYGPMSTAVVGSQAP